ncbi:PDZ domain-containing protein [candidate division KSB1 bacterium]|nr:PDZ domain-containing protein [candidate division KSB1 bacterium]
MAKRTHLNIAYVAWMLVSLSFILFLACDDECIFTERDSDERGWIGIRFTRLTPELREELGTETREGVVITEVFEDSPGEKAGLKRDDIILRFNRRRMRKESDLLKRVARCEPDDKVRLEIERKREVQTITFRAGKRPAKFTQESDADWHINLDFPSKGEFSFFMNKANDFQGARLQNLNADLASYFNVNASTGVLILDVKPDSPADNAGLKPGDIITQLEGKAVSSIEDILDIRHETRKQNQLELKFLRKGEANSATVEVKRRRFRSHQSPHKLRLHVPALHFEFGDEFEKNVSDFAQELEESIREEIGENIVENLDDVEQMKDDVEAFKREMRQFKRKMRSLGREIKDSIFII